MDKKSKILIVVIFLLIIASLIATYYRIYIKKDYMILVDIPCDPSKQQCFEYQCIVGVDDGCSNNPAEQITYFKYIQKKAFNIETCNTGDKKCPLLSCEQNEKDCKVIYCTSETKKEVDICSEPSKYLTDHPNLPSNDSSQ